MQSIARYSDLAGKGVFITGGATGIGADLVTAFAEQGARVLFADIDQEAGEDLAARLRGAVAFRRCDVTNDEALAEAMNLAGAQGGLDILINNAANDTRHDIDEIDADRWRAIVDVNLRHQFVAARAAARLMRPRGEGAIVNFGSVAPEMMVENLTVYSMCKAGVRGLTRSLARDLGPSGVRVNSHARKLSAKDINSSMT